MESIPIRYGIRYKILCVFAEKTFRYMNVS